MNRRLRPLVDRVACRDDRPGPRRPTRPRWSVLHGSVTHERHLPVAPAQVFAAFADPAQRRRWFRVPSEPGTGYHHLDFRVGGGERAGGVFTPMDVAEELEYRSRFVDIVPDERIVFLYEFLLDGRRRTVALVTVELVPAAGGTRLSYTEQYALLEVSGDGRTDVAHQEGSLPLLLNGLTAAVAPSPSGDRLG